MKTLTRIAAAVSVVSLASGAHAGVITTSMSLSQLLNSPSGSYSGSFALGSLLAANGMPGGQINAAVISAYGYSDTQANQSGYTTTNGTTTYSGQQYMYSYSYRCGSYWSPHTCYVPVYGYALYRDIDYVNQVFNTDSVVDTMKLSAGAGSATGAVGHSGGSYDYGYFSYGSSNGTLGHDNVYQHTHETDSYESGALGASYAMSAADLMALANSGNLDFLVSALAGNFYLQQISLTLDVGPAPVPEPASAALMLAGLAGLAGAARARRRSKTPS